VSAGLLTLPALICESFGRCRSIGISSQLTHGPERQRQSVTELGKAVVNHVTMTHENVGTEAIRRPGVRVLRRARADSNQ